MCEEAQDQVKSQKCGLLSAIGNRNLDLTEGLCASCSQCGTCSC